MTEEPTNQPMTPTILTSTPSRPTMRLTRHRLLSASLFVLGALLPCSALAAQGAKGTYAGQAPGNCQKADQSGDIQPAVRGTPPSALLGEFRDDYGNSFRISHSAFVHLPRTCYRIVEWQVEERYLIAQNDAGNQGDAGLWTRIDWMTFSDMAPYAWGFCLTAYRAATEAEARATPPANRASPRTGCNGFPFSRMRPPE